MSSYVCRHKRHASLAEKLVKLLVKSWLVETIEDQADKRVTEDISSRQAWSRAELRSEL